MPAIWGDGELSVPQNLPPKSLLSHVSFLREKGKYSQLVMEMEGQRHHHSPLFAGLLTSCGFPLDAVFLVGGGGGM